MAYLNRLIPALTIIVMTVLVALPWGVAAERRFLLPMLPLIVIHYWTLRRPDAVAEWMAFSAGLCLDILTGGPLGFWALIYLLGFAAAKISTGLKNDRAVAKWVLAATTLFVLSGVSWLLSSLYYFEPADWRPFLIAAVAASLLYPAIGVLLRHTQIERRHRPLFHGRRS